MPRNDEPNIEIDESRITIRSEETGETAETINRSRSNALNSLAARWDTVISQRTQEPPPQRLQRDEMRGLRELYNIARESVPVTDNNEAIIEEYVPVNEEQNIEINSIRWEEPVNRRSRWTVTDETPTTITQLVNEEQNIGTSDLQEKIEFVYPIEERVIGICAFCE